MKTNLAITIARQYGSGGHDIGEMIAEKLELPLYDRELIKIAAEKSGMSRDMLENLDERATNSLLYSLALGSAGYGHFSPQSVELPLTDKLFIMQCDIIKEAAENGGCVVVGRCGDYILKDNPRCFKVFIHSKLENRARRISEKNGISIEKAWEFCQKTDKKRAGYYNFYAGGKWGIAENYDLCIDSSIGAENAADIIIKAAEIKAAQLGK